MKLGMPACVGLTLFALAAQAGEFDRLEGERLANLTGGAGAVERKEITFRALEALPAVLPDDRAALVVVQTSEGNVARLLVSPGLRKAPGTAGKAAPVLVVERFATFERGQRAARVAKGEGLILFDGFKLDLDVGQVVPEGQGGDLALRADGEGGGTLLALTPAKLFTAKDPLPQAPPSPGPSPGKAVLPADFAGRYRLQADGRWSGLLELKVGPDKELTGLFRSEPGGHAYPAAGTIDPAHPHRATFTVKFPRSEQEYDAYLATEGKASLAGTFLMGGRTFGFYALREAAAP